MELEGSLALWPPKKKKQPSIAGPSHETSAGNLHSQLDESNISTIPEEREMRGPDYPHMVQLTRGDEGLIHVNYEYVLVPYV